MTVAIVTRKIALPPQQVWKTLGSFQSVDRYHPLVERVSSNNNLDQGLGAHRTCHFYDGTSVDEEVISWEEGKSFEVRLSKFSMPLKEAVGRITLTALEDGTSEVSLGMEFTAKGGPAGWVMAQVMMKPMMIRMVKQVLAGLELHLQTGRSIGRNGKPVTEGQLSTVV